MMDAQEQWRNFANWLRWYSGEYCLPEERRALNKVADAADMIAADIPCEED
jgi:hypothetical protein